MDMRMGVAMEKGLPAASVLVTLLTIASSLASAQTPGAISAIYKAAAASASQDFDEQSASTLHFLPFAHAGA